jgi:SAM-dependent methyltransferase
VKQKIETFFDQAAAKYDATFTHSEIGKLQRARVYYYLEKLGFFRKKRKVFEVNCGTGYDADQFVQKGQQVVATDVSPTMIDLARKARSNEINFYPLPFHSVPSDENFKKAEALFSNFGGMNCMSEQELKDFTEATADLQSQGDWWVAVLMARHCFMEDVYHSLRFQFSKLNRRNTNKALEVQVEGEQVPTYYHRPGDVKKMLEKTHHIHLISPVAFFLPPSYLEAFFRKRKYLLRILNNLERWFARGEKLASWSDHYIIIAERK